MLSQLQANTRVSRRTESGGIAAGRHHRAAKTRTRTGVQNAQVAALAAQGCRLNKRPRRTFVAPSGEASRYAQYLDAWRSG